MKFFEKTIIITFMCLCIFGIKTEAYAEDLQEYSGTLPPDESIGEVTYTLDYVTFSTLQNPPDAAIGCVGNGTMTYNGYNICAYKEIQTTDLFLKFIVYNKNGYKYLGWSINNSYVSQNVGSCKQGCFYLDTLEFYDTKYVHIETFSYLCGDSKWDEGWTSASRFVTTIPIFADEQTAIGFMNGSVRLNQADNYEDLISISYDSTDIPIPHNLKVTDENSKYYISWSQTSEELPFISEVSYRRHIDALQITHETEGVYPTYPPKPELFYNPQLLHKYEITDEILNIVKFYREKCGVDSFKCSYVIRIRNKFVKSETEILYSNVVRAVLTISYDVNSGIKISAEYEEKTESGDYVPDSSYNDYGDGSGLIRDDIGAASGGSLSTGNFISNIVNGFGLLGNGGIVSLAASALSFIPSELWTLIYFALSLFLIIALFKLVIK